MLRKISFASKQRSAIDSQAAYFIGKFAHHRNLTAEQVKKMLGTGKTGVIKGFVSNRTRRKFEAHLTFKAKEGKNGFDFPLRPAKKAAQKVAKTAEE